MKDLSLLSWFMQLGLSVAIPPVALILLAVWLRNSFSMGQWVLWVAGVLGIYCAITGLVSALRTLFQLTKQKDETQIISFNDHE